MIALPRGRYVGKRLGDPPKDEAEYFIRCPACGGWDVGRIYETRGGPDSLRWFWSMTVNGPMTRADRVATLEEAKAQFQKSWTP
jgi:hypothetical protein